MEDCMKIEITITKESVDALKSLLLMFLPKEKEEERERNEETRETKEEERTKEEVNKESKEDKKEREEEKENVICHDGNGNDNNNSDKWEESIPTLLEVQQYVALKEIKIDPVYFFNYYTAKGWVDSGGYKIKDWKAVAKAWENNGRKNIIPKVDPMKAPPKTRHVTLTEF